MEEIYKYKKVSDKIMTIYNITIKDGNPKGGWYRQLTSIESFVENIGKRWYDKFYLNQNDFRIISRCDKGDVDGGLLINSYLDEQEHCSIEHKHFESVWDFYDHIGYDYKNKSKRQLDNLIVNWRD